MYYTSSDLRMTNNIGPTSASATLASFSSAHDIGYHSLTHFRVKFTYDATNVFFELFNGSRFISEDMSFNVAPRNEVQWSKIA